MIRVVSHNHLKMFIFRMNFIQIKVLSALLTVYDTILQQNYFFTKTEVNRKRSAKWVMKLYLITPYSLSSRSSLAIEVLVSSRSFLRTHTSDIHLYSPKSTPWLLCSSLSLLPLLMPFPYLSVSLCLE